MSHFLLTVVGDHIESQLAIYDVNLQVERFKDYLSDDEVVRMLDHLGHDNDPVDCIQEWTGFEGGYDGRLFYWSTRNPRGKWDWYLMGGKWCGYLKLKHGARGEIGKRGAGVADDDPLPYGVLSADQALYGDIDWHGMRMQLRVEAERVWEMGLLLEDLGEPWRFKYGVEHWMEREDFIEARSHPASFAVLKDSEWYERGNKGWWGPILDAQPVTEWHQRFDELLADCKPHTLITMVDCHIQGGPP